MRIIQYLRNAGATNWGGISPSIMKEKGLGGRESALVHLSENWAKQGHEVINFVNSEESEKFEYKNGTSYYVPTKDIVPYCKNFGADVLISWEEAGIADVPEIVDNVKLKVIEMQVAHLDTDRDTDSRTDYYAVLSNWAGAFLREQNPFISEDKVVVFPNCVDLNRFNPELAQTSRFGKPEFFYSSSPDRGLVNLLRMWPKILQEWPDAKLHVAYGIEKWVEAVKWSHNIWSELALAVEEGIKQDGIIYHGKIGQNELAEIQQNCSAMLYPCETLSPTETGCISVVEACAAGAIPLITDCDCLGTEFGHFAPHVQLPFNDDQYIDLLKKIMTDEDYYNTCQSNAIEFSSTRSWEDTAANWISWFKDELNKKELGKNEIEYSIGAINEVGSSA